MITENTAVRVQRTIDAPPERVFRAWLEPELAARWFAPRDWTVARAEVEERVGGRFSIYQQDADGTDLGGMEAQILELVPNERLSFDWHFVGPERDTPGVPTRLTVTFAPAGGDPSRTELTLVHERLDSFREAYPDAAEMVTAGWGMVFDKLEGVV